MALAEMTAAEFEAYVTGRTLFYSQGGAAPYGAEVYLPNRRVRWSFLDGECAEGSWYEADGLICFAYEDRPDDQCWSFRQGPTGLIARYENDPGDNEVYQAQDTGEPLICPGPKVGV